MVQTRDTAQRPPVHWAVRMNYRNRALSWVLVFGVFASHLAGRDTPSWVWALLVLQFLLYPQLAYWRARRAADPLQAEIHNMLFDGLAVGVWLAALGFPLWITGMLVIGVGMNLLVYRGLPGLVRAVVALGLGFALGAAVFGLRFEPDTSTATALLAIACQALYLLMFTQDAYARTLRLQETRLRLRESEQALQQQLQEVQLLQAQLTEQANRDPLTGLFNRRYLDATMQREIARCRREALPLSLMLIDIDHFKQVNDRHGHQAGDAVLVALADLLQEGTRAGDVVCRYGGEEFLVLLPGMPLEAAQERAVAYRRALEARPVRSDDQVLPVRLSIGIAAFPQHAQQAQDLIVAADQALYAAKSGGRDQVAVYLPPAAAPAP